MAVQGPNLPIHPLTRLTSHGHPRFRRDWPGVKLPQRPPGHRLNLVRSSHRLALALDRCEHPSIFVALDELASQTNRT